MALEISLTGVTYTLLALLITFLFVQLIGGLNRKHPSPPGPWGLPIVGHLFQLGESPHLSLTHLREAYGDVFRIKLGLVPVVVISGLETVKEALLKKGDTFAGRPQLITFSFFADGKSMSFSETVGDSWKQQKKIARNSLRTLAKSEAKVSTCSCLLEEHVSAEASELVKIFVELSSKDTYFNPSNSTTNAVANVICALCFGKRYEHNDSELMDIVKINDDFRVATSAVNPADYLPGLRYLPLNAIKAARTFYQNFNNFIARHVKEHYTSYDKDHIRDITDALISLCENRNPDGKLSTLSDEKIIVTVNDVFGAGFDTIATSLSWCLLYLINYPDIQTKIQQEIDEKIGGNRLPRFDDRKDLHYSEGFINEIFRHTSFMPFPIPHCTTEDTVLNGYFIPRKTTTLLNFYQINHDETIWRNADTFKPERFLDVNGELDKSKVEKVMMFGMGTRKCLGEDVGRNEVFLLLTTILQQLKLEKEKEEKLDMTPVSGLSLKPKAYMLKAAMRS
ncbi:cytochrome P450 1A4-like [Ambystoma mexicanum]|uniref:cytochrome P450 1A4-like n=1 Tax=Ambystoma mexicanum TaxID=8296 RepID=UPI0037E8E9B3